MNLKKIVNNYKYFDNINNKNKEIFDIMDTYQGKEQKRFLKLIKALPILFILLPFIPTFLILASPVINVFIYFGTLICLILFTFIFAHLKFKKPKVEYEEIIDINYES